jgi:hypothetical protein
MRGRMMEPVDIRRILGIQDKPKFSTRLYRWLCHEPQSIIAAALIGLGCAAVCLYVVFVGKSLCGAVMRKLLGFWNSGHGWLGAARWWIVGGIVLAVWAGFVAAHEWLMNPGPFTALPIDTHAEIKQAADQGLDIYETFS